MKEFFYMGGYAFFVWTSYALTAIVLISNIVIPVIKHKSLKQKLNKKLLRAEQLK